MSLLAVNKLSVRFGGHRALNEVDLAVEAGQVTGLIGPNGAGKTTLFNTVCGVTPPTSGSIRLADRDISGLDTFERARRGIGRTFQRLEVFSSLSVRDNVLVGLEIRRGWSRRHTPAPQFLAHSRDLKPADEVDLILDRLALHAVADQPVGALPTGQARLVELGRALAARPTVLLLDEPASGLDENETEAFGNLLIELARAGLGILLVEHDVALVMRVCTDLSVLDFGEIIAHGPPERIRTDEAVLTAYLGGGGDGTRTGAARRNGTRAGGGRPNGTAAAGGPA